MKDYLKIGYTQKPHGVKGEIKIFIEEEYFDVFEEGIDVFYLKMKGNFIPYFLEAIRGASANIIKFEEVDSPEEARKIASKEMYVKADALPVVAEAEPLETSKYGYCIDFQVIDKYLGQLGKIEEVIDYPQQEMAIMPFDGNTVFIPLHDQILMKVDKENKIMYVDLPEGLITL